MRTVGMIPRSTILAVHRKPDQSTLGSTTEVDESHLHRGKRSVVYQHRPARLSTVFGDAQRATPEAQAETGHVVGQPQSDSTSAADMPENGHTRETTRWSRFGSSECSLHCVRVCGLAVHTRFRVQSARCRLLVCMVKCREARRAMRGSCASIACCPDKHCRVYCWLTRADFGGRRRIR